MNRFQVDAVRDAAHRLQDSDPNLAFDLICIAMEARPQGGAILSLFNKLKRQNGYVTISLIGNCQVTPIARLLREKNSQIKVLKVVSAHLYKKHEESIYSIFDRSDYIVSQSIGDSFEGINTATLKGIYKDKLITIPNLFYRGLHPDWIYLPRVRGVRLQSPIGDYHNRTVLDGYISSLSPEKVLSNMDSITYNQSHYSGVADDSLSELAKREAFLDIKMLGDIKEELERQGECFHTFNHPNKRLLNNLVNRILDFLNLGCEKISVPGECLDGVILRTNPIVSGRSKRYIFKSGHLVDPLDFIVKSFEIYKNSAEFIEQYKKAS